MQENIKEYLERQLQEFHEFSEARIRAIKLHPDEEFRNSVIAKIAIAHAQAEEGMKRAAERCEKSMKEVEGYYDASEVAAIVKQQLEMTIQGPRALLEAALTVIEARMKL